MALTLKQRTAMRALDWYRVMTPEELSLFLHTSPEGAAKTASSLVRRGLARRVSRQRHVAYEVV